MNQEDSTAAVPWYASRPFRVAIVLLLLAIATAEGAVSVFHRQTDFEYHHLLGEAFLSGDPYRDGRRLYPATRAMLDAPPALMPSRVARGVCYVLAIAALGICFVLWERLAAVRVMAPRGVAAAAGAAAVLMLLPYVLRDLDDCGLQIFLLTLLSAGGYALLRRRPLWAGFWLAAATAYKVTPVLFLPLLLWKRQWRAAAAMAAFLALWAAAPALWLGWDQTVACHRQWLASTGRILAARQAYPSLLEAEAPKQQNVGLQAMLARYLETHPPGHPLHLEHPLFLQFGNLSPHAAWLTVRICLLALAVLLAWRFRKRWGTAEEDADLAAEWAALCILCALLSPLCWKQHLVMALPALFVAVRSGLSLSYTPPWRVGLSLFIVLTAYACRHGIAGRELSIVLLSYKLDTLAMLAALLLALTLPRPCALAHSASSATVEPARSRRAA